MRGPMRAPMRGPVRGNVALKQTMPADSGHAVRLDAAGVYYRDLNQMIRRALGAGANLVEIDNVQGQRYIGTNLFGLAGGQAGRVGLTIRVHGTPGSDLAAFMDGPTVEVFGNAQDAVGNTMNGGRVVVHGSAGDVLGYGMRGGEIFVRGNVGYRVGIHMKEYQSKVPVIVAGGAMQDFFGEYMAGGRIVILNHYFEGNPPMRPGCFIGTGMHGGAIFVRGEVAGPQIGREVGMLEPTREEMAAVRGHVREFCRLFHCGKDVGELMKVPFVKLYPRYLRPYGRHYAY
jgi:glutamate synthase domain-containing protein 3